MMQFDVGSLHADGLGSAAKGQLGAQPPLQECLSVWVPWADMITCGGASHHAIDCEGVQHVDTPEQLVFAPFQGWQPYVAWDRWYDIPFPHDQDMHCHDIIVGGDFHFSRFCQPGRSMSLGGEDVAEGDSLDDEMPSGSVVTQDANMMQMEAQIGTHVSKYTWDRTAALGSTDERPSQVEDAVRPTGALPMRSSEQLGTPRLAICGTLDGSDEHQVRQEEAPRATQQKLLGRGKRAREDAVWEDEPDQQQYTSPGRLQNRLQVLQQRAKEAIDGLPVECREDVQFGTHETRVWALEALKHALKMRLALQSNIYLCRPVDAGTCHSASG